MTSMTDAPENPLALRSVAIAQGRGGRVIRWLRANLFSSIPSTRHLAAADLPARESAA